MLFLLFSLIAHAADLQTIETARGEKIVAQVSLPRGNPKQKVPLLLFAPGESCGEKPLTETITGAFVEKGWAVLSFQYAYCVKNPQNPAPSAELSDEADDFEGAFRFAKKMPRVDTNKIFFAGKSLGARVAYKAFEGRPQAVALALLAPASENFEKAFPNFKDEARPVFLAWGNSDATCSSEAMFRILRYTAGNAMPMEFSGNHDFNIEYADKKIDEGNSKLTHRELGVFMENYFRRFLGKKK